MKEILLFVLCIIMGGTVPALWGIANAITAKQCAPAVEKK